MVTRTPDIQSWGDSSLENAGGFSTKMKFWWHLQWPNEIQTKTLKYFTVQAKHNDELISIYSITDKISFCGLITKEIMRLGVYSAVS